MQNKEQNILKEIITNHIYGGYYVVIDSWSGYNYIDIADNDHHVYNYNRGNFWHEVDTTSRIEGTWRKLKYYLKKIYAKIRSINFIFFIKEVEFRRMMRNSYFKTKLETFSIAASCVSNGKEGDLLS